MSYVSRYSSQKRRGKGGRLLKYYRPGVHHKGFTRYKSPSARSPMRGRYMPGFPAYRTINMRYAAVIALDPAAGAVASVNFRANSIFDPDVLSGVPKNPLGFKEWNVFYNHYLVSSCKLQANFMADNTNVTPLILGTYLADDGVIPTVGQDLIEQGLAKWKIVSPGTNNGTKSTIVTNYFNAKKFFNIKDYKDNFDRLGASFQANPQEIAQFHIFASALDTTVNAPLIHVQIILDYTVILSEPRSLTPSPAT